MRPDGIAMTKLQTTTQSLRGKDVRLTFPLFLKTNHITESPKLSENKRNLGKGRNNNQDYWDAVRLNSPEKSQNSVIIAYRKAA